MSDVEEAREVGRTVVVDGSVFVICGTVAFVAFVACITLVAIFAPEMLGRL